MTEIDRLRMKNRQLEIDIKKLQSRIDDLKTQKQKNLDRINVLISESQPFEPIKRSLL